MLRETCAAYVEAEFMVKVERLMSPNPKIRYYSGWHSNMTGIMCRFAPDRFPDSIAKKIFALN